MRDFKSIDRIQNPEFRIQNSEFRMGIQKAVRRRLTVKQILDSEF